jgi:hypothetical protein
VLGQPQGRRLPVHNLGSSGQDGVEIQLHSVMGGGAGFEVAPLLSVAGSEIKIRHKGWDGLIYGNHRVVSNGDGTGTLHFDFSSLGVSSLNIKVLADDGTVTETYDVDGGVAARPWVPNFTCPNGGQPVLWLRWITPCHGCQPVLVVGWSCLTNTGTTGEYSWQGRMMVTPTTGPGSPPVPPLESALISAVGLPSLTLNGAAIDSLGVPASGVGDSHIGEVCDDSDGDGDCDAFRLPVTNLGSSGQDGVALDLGDDAAGFEMELSRGNCCPGHVTLMKVYDDVGGEQRITRTTVSISPDGAVDEELRADFPQLGGEGYILTCIGAGGVVIGPPGGTAIINGGPMPVFTNRCPNGGTEWWINVGTPGNPVWQFQGCNNNNNMVIPTSTGGTITLSEVAGFEIRPLNPAPSTASKIRHVVITKNGTEMELSRVIVHPPNHNPTCGTSDFNGDGDIGTDADIEAFFACLGGSCCTTCYEGGSDFNADGDFGTDADIESFFRVLGGGNC